ncbi:sugar ABC transporter substrate-binding protein [Histophilus somni]|uniref:Sugar ABC transporter substrate-binding protein n=1 Tax=Histophilus somni TaxID=731 RepID=A0AAX2S3D7_HISSO|nr:substrate-binding domain-containing protein [Histophilus somni]QEH08125.1 sugar ABC transporter substrate-binding protein [Histophilus somni]QEH13298.1 sugar ABC transporter substrate-binding protein [Histophilus somni]QEH24396.1 sugar ABC transporter substrate-binding protein [Histophilus somni]QEH27776.1 sugar ABC transporter substrate-binding protein [Histophilus somni]QEH51978.1 sugar ABC transporter substrate-binding protein [Histophilus somni]
MKKTLLAMLCGGLLLTSQAVIAKNYVIGAPMNSFADKWQTYLQDAVRDFDEKHDDVQIKLADSNSDPNIQVNLVQNFIDQNVDALLVVPTDPTVVKRIGVLAKKAGIPLIVVNRKPNDEHMKYVTSFVGSDEIEGGRIQGDFIANTLAGKNAESLILLGPLGQDAVTKRTQGNEEIFAQHKNIKVVSKQEGRWERDRGLAIAENVLAGNKGINVIVSNNDEMAIGAILATRKLGIKDEDITIVGLDATPDALEYLGKGLDATVFQSAQGQGYTGAEMAYLAAKGEKVPSVKWVPFELVTPDKKEEYQARYK